jgi:hypothetical protein
VNRDREEAMDLDLNELLGDWRCSGDEVCARLIRGRDGDDVVQLRVDLGLLQMFLDGRPDGLRYHGLPSVYDYLQHESRVGYELTEEDWRELHRELQQYNYRRLALSSLAEEALREKELEQGRSYLRRTLRDIERCLAILHRLEENGAEWDSALAVLVPTLVFSRARLLTRLRVAENRIDEAIEEVERGVRELNQALAEAGFEQEQREQNPAVAHLCQLGRRLREQHGITRTLKERLHEAIEREDFELAARLRDELRRRQQSDLQPKLPFSEEG